MLKLKMLWTSDYDKEAYDELAKYFEITIPGFDPSTGKRVRERLDEESLIKALQGMDVFMGETENVTERVIVNAPDLKLIVSVKDGPEERIDVMACERHGLPLLSSMGRCTVSVAEFTFCLMLLLARPIIAMTNQVRKSGWALVPRDATSTELCGKTVGIVGLGRIGYRFAQYAKAFEMQVLAHDPYVDKAKMEREGIRIVPLDDLMRSADYVVVMARLTNETKGIISREKIGLMKPTACLINTARAQLIDTDALLDALAQDRIRAAALDVHAKEPLELNRREFAIDPHKLILTPHMAGYTAERVRHQYRLLLPQIKAFLFGEPIRLPYTPRVEASPEYANRGGLLYGCLSRNMRLTV